MTVSEPQALEGDRPRQTRESRRVSPAVRALRSDVVRRAASRGGTDAPRRVALPTVMSISPTRLIDYTKTWRGREATSRQRCCRIVFIFVGDHKVVIITVRRPVYLS